MNSNKHKNEEQNFPGYPHYPASEDIMKNNADEARKDLDVEGLSTSQQINRNGDVAAPSKQPDTTANTDDENDVSAQERHLLDAIDQSSTGTSERTYRVVLDQLDEEGDPLNENGSMAQFGDELDIPGSEDDDDMEDIGSEDEENNYYSLGSDNNDGLEAGDDR